MKIKWGALVVDGRGKIGGQVASKNRSGAYMRNKVTPVNPQSTAQNAVRNTLSTLSQGWRALTQNQRDAWDGAVANFASTNIFGDIINPTGKNLYTALNANLASVGEAAISTPPTLAEVVGIAVGAITVAVGAGTYSAVFTGDDPSMIYQIWATASVSPGKSFVKNLYRQIGFVAGGAGSPLDFSADYLAKYGAAIESQKVFFKMVGVVSTTGQKGVGSSGFAIAAA